MICWSAFDSEGREYAWGICCWAWAGAIGVSEHHNYILMEVCLPTTLTRHFSLRLKQYLLFLQATNDLELLQLILSFLPLKDLLNFLAVSTHFASFKRLQSVEIRILRAKLAHLQKPEEPIAWNPYLHLLPIKAVASQSKPQKINDGKKAFALLKQELKHLIDPKRKNGPKDFQQKTHQRTGIEEFSKFNQELNTEGRQLEERLKEPAEGWANVSQASQNDYVISQFRHVHSQSEKGLPAVNKPTAPHPLPKSSPSSPLDLLQHHHARIDYERRKAKRMQQKKDFIPVEQFKRLAEQDPCSREIFNSVYEEEKLKQQQRNVARLRMAPTPDPSKFQLEAVEVKVKKQSIAGKMFLGIKELLAMEGRL